MKKCNNPNCESKGEFLPLISFSKNKNNKDGYSFRCKECVKKSVRKSYIKNREYYCKIENERNKKWKKLNPNKYDKQREHFNQKYKNEGYFKKYYKENKKRLSEYSKREDVKEKRKGKWRDRYKNDINFRLKEIIRANFHLFFKNRGVSKNLSFSKIVNYSYNELRYHLENNFRKGMSWDNLGQLWEIHHIKPQNLFDPQNKQEIKECWKLINLIPLWKTTRISKQMGDNTKGNRNVGKNEIYNPGLEV